MSPETKVGPHGGLFGAVEDEFEENLVRGTLRVGNDARSRQLGRFSSV